MSRSRAILIGNAVYRRDAGIPELPAATRCVAAMEQLLTGDLCGWPGGRVDTLVDVAAPHELARRVTHAVKDVRDVLLVYYVGHGLRTPRGQLALALGDSDGDPTLAAHTAILYENLADVLRGSPAATKLVILDCCHAELGNKANYVFQSADLAEVYPVDGLYFIGASKAYEKAKAPVDAVLTSFTENLIGTIQQGVPGKPAWLALDQIFVELRGRMLRQGLPEPVESGIRGAHRFPFARNVAPAESDLEPRVAPPQEMDLGDIVDTLSRLEPDEAAARLKELGPESAARVIVAMPPQHAAPVLTAMAPRAAAAILDRVRPESAAAVLCAMHQSWAADRLNAMDQDHAVAVMDQMHSGRRARGRHKTDAEAGKP